MTKLYIFGDSYAATDHVTNLLETSWTFKLSKLLNVELVNLARSGTSLYYSYNQLISVLDKINYDEDYIVFIVTFPGRLYVDDETTGLCNLATVEHYLKNKERPFLTDKLLAAQQYFMHLYNHNYDHTINRLVVQETKNILKNIKNQIIVPVSETCPAVSYSTNFNLFDDLCKTVQYKNYQELIFNGRIYYEKLANHLTTNNNSILANYFYDLLTRGQSSITIDSFEQFPEPIDQWFTK